MDDIFNVLLKNATNYNCCKNCRYSYLRDDSEMGYCKRPENAYGIMPKIVDEMYICPLWEGRIINERTRS